MNNLWLQQDTGAMLAVVNFSSLAFGTFLACLCLIPALRNAKRKRLADNLPISKTAGVFIGFVKLQGAAESGAPPFLSPLAGQPCVQYSWTIEEQWSRVVTETYTDSNGRRQTRQRTEKGWKTVANGSQGGPFYLQDDCGIVQIRPEGATIEPLEILEQTCGPDNPLYYAKGPPNAIPDSTFQRRFHEVAIPLHCPLYVIGQARERTDIVAPEIAQDQRAPMFLISTRTEEQVGSRLGWLFWVWSALGLFLSVFFFGRWAAVPYLLVLALAWTWMVFNSMIYLRQRVRQARSEVDVQLKRRADLIPKLVSVVQGFRNYEAMLQPELAIIRSQLTATTTGMAGTHLQAVKQTVEGIAERYPELKANKSFADLQRNLIETEQRIALARGYFNDITTRYNIRLQILPDRYITRMGGMKPEPLMQADDFERAPILVNLDKTPSQFSSHAIPAVAVASAADSGGATNRPPSTVLIQAAMPVPVRVESSEAPPHNPSAPVADFIPGSKPSSGSKTVGETTIKDVLAPRGVWSIALAGVALLVFLLWIGTLFRLSGPAKSAISNSTPAAIGLISSFTAILAGSAGFVLRRKLRRNHFRSSCAVSLALSCVSLITYAFVMSRYVNAIRKAQAKAEFDQIAMLYRTAQYNNVCEEFEKAIEMAHSAPYDAYLRYIAACTYIRHGEAAGKSAEQFLKTFGWSSTPPAGGADWSPWVVLFGYVGYQESGDNRAAKQLINEGVVECNNSQRLYPVIAYLHGDMDESALASSIGNNPVTMAEAKTFIAFQELYNGHREEAIADLLWVAEKGRRDVEVYRLAISELRRATLTGTSQSQTGQELIPTDADLERARTGFSRVELFWKSSEYEKLCEEFDEAFSLFPVPSYNAFCDYVAASTYLRHGDSGGRFARYFLGTFGWTTDNSPYHVLYGYVGYRQAGNLAAAKQLLDGGAVKCNTSRWPYPLIAYLRGDIGVAELNSFVGNNRQRRTEADTFAGIQELYDGNQADAVTHLTWVQKNGLKEDAAYALAAAELAHTEVPNALPAATESVSTLPLTTMPLATTATPSEITTSPTIAALTPTNRLRDVVNAVVRLAKNGLSDTVISQYASAHVPNPPLTAEERDYLKANGVSQDVIDVFWRNGLTPISQPESGQGKVDLHALVKMANDRYNLHQYQEAIDYCNQALRLDPRSANAWYVKAISEDALHNSSEAIAAFSNFIEFAPAQDLRSSTLRAYATTRLKVLRGW